MKIFKEVFGHGEEVILLHGWALDHRFLQPLISHLKDRFHITTVDLPGCGWSEWSPNLRTIHDMADLLLPFLPKSAIYIGSSIGGCIAMSIAARYPERVKRLIGVGTTPRFLEAKNWPGAPEPGFSVNNNMIREMGIKAFMQKVIEMEFSGFASKPSAYYELLKFLDEKVIKLETFLKGIDILDTLDLRQEIQSLKCPVDLVFGEDDTFVPVAVAEAIRKLNPQIQTHIITKAYHTPYLTHPKEFDNLLDQILKSAF